MPVFFPDEAPREPARPAEFGGMPSRGSPPLSKNARGENRGSSGAKTETASNRKQTRFSDKPLSNQQKWELSDLAEAAYKQLAAKGQLAPLASDPGSAKRQLEAFRVEQADIACGVRISGALQRHYNDLKAHFEAILGQTGAAFGTLMRRETNGQRQAMWKLQRALAERKLTEGYALTIARAKFKKHTLESLNEKQLWVLFYDITGRRSKGGGPAPKRQRRVAPIIQGNQPDPDIAF